MPLLRHLEVSAVFSVLSQVLHSWILTYITSPSPEFDVSQGEIWLIACLINKEGLRAFFPFQPGLMSLYCGCITHIKDFHKETWSPGKLQGKIWWPLKPSSWAVAAKYTRKRVRAQSHYYHHYHYHHHNENKTEWKIVLPLGFLYDFFKIMSTQSVAVEQLYIFQPKWDSHTISFY